MTEFKKILLARVHELVQTHVDRVTWFLLTSANDRLGHAQREDLYISLYGVTSSLGKHTTAVFSKRDQDLSEHLEQLFDKLEALDTKCINSGGPAVGYGLSEYRRKLMQPDFNVRSKRVGRGNHRGSIQSSRAPAG